MNTSFRGALEAILKGQPRPEPSAPAPAAAPATRAGKPGADNTQRWFAEFAETQAMPLLREAAEAAERHRGVKAQTSLAERDGRLTAELVITPLDLPERAQPPRFLVYAPGDGRPLEVEYTGTFPVIGRHHQRLRYEAEVDYDAIFPSQLEERLLDFVKMATAE